MATIGPSIHDTDELAMLMEAGMAAGRVDLTWGGCRRQAGRQAIVAGKWRWW